MKNLLHYSHELPKEGSSEEIGKFLVEHWGSTIVVSRGNVIDAIQLPRYVARDANDKLVGLVTYRIDRENQACELVSINSELEGRGIGTKLIRMLEAEAKKSGCKRIWLITTNDNPEAAAFYVKRGYRLTKIHLYALEKSRQLKPQIPIIGKHGILLTDEWEFEKIL